MAILKKNPKFKFTSISNGLISELSLSHVEFRVLVYLISKPNNWKVNNNDVMRRLNIKTRDTISKIWKKLESKGFIKRNTIRENGKFKGYDYILTDKCYETKPCTVKPDTVETEHETNRHGLNLTHSNTDIYSNTEINNTERESHSLFVKWFFDNYPLVRDKSKTINFLNDLTDVDQQKIKNHLLKYLANCKKTKRQEFTSLNYLKTGDWKNSNTPAGSSTISYSEKIKQQLAKK